MRPTSLGNILAALSVTCTLHKWKPLLGSIAFGKMDGGPLKPGFGLSGNVGD
ncbi:MAG: hypothetical protein JWN74_2067 [Acidobacteriaceae bacterium]|nr:hypothetical protein [Acidobacteriaceae bacterium]